ncbi:MAG TPA: YggS family pyridoxal phosphate-dependent enzyme [Clostridiaceae bacterium]|nr:YggS family pyridoxal phosphate-dependent enzyme [Clostridiaceae bacterium]
MNNNNTDIASNIIKLKERVANAALRSGRTINDIKIVAVTKTVEPERINIAVEQGLVDLGENRVQELCNKYGQVNGKCNWHLIGHLQTNKVKYIVDKVCLIHSLDRMELAEELQKRASQHGKILDVLVQVNIAKEETKFGINQEDAVEFIKEISKFENLKVKGLMTIAPLVEDPEEVRYVFRELRKLLIDIQMENINNIDMKYLSMGMSNDFEVAIEEGANIIRVGTAIFGHR